MNVNWELLIHNSDGRQTKLKFQQIYECHVLRNAAKSLHIGMRTLINKNTTEIELEFIYDFSFIDLYFHVYNSSPKFFKSYFTFHMYEVLRLLKAEPDIRTTVAKAFLGKGVAVKTYKGQLSFPEVPTLNFSTSLGER